MLQFKEDIKIDLTADQYEESLKDREIEFYVEECGKIKEFSLRNSDDTTICAVFEDERFKVYCTSNVDFYKGLQATIFANHKTKENSVRYYPAK